MQWVKNRLIPALKAAYPQCFSATRDAHMTIVMDRAPYHCASSGDRFNPLDAGHKPSREALVDKMRAIMAAKGHAATLVVTHKNVVQAPGQPPADVVLNVALDDAEKARKGKPGVNAAVGELRAAAYAWLIEHSPETLLNDVEAYLRAECPRVHVLWSAPNCPELNPIEMVWAQAKLYVACKFTGKRSKAELRRHFHDGLYTDRLAKPGQLNVRGGNFVRDPATGKCAAAASLFAHVHHARKGGVQTALRDDKVLAAAGGPGHVQVIGALKFGSLSALQLGEVVGEALQYTALAQVKWLMQERLKKLPVDGPHAAVDLAAEQEYIHGHEPDEVDEG